MIPTDKIKWIIENIKPEGFEYKASKYNHLDDQIRFVNGDYAKRYDLYSDEWKYDKYGDFLQRVIEYLGCNTDYIVIQGDNFINVTHKDSEFITDEVFGEDESHIDEYKEKAILYIVDKMRGKV